MSDKIFALYPCTLSHGLVEHSSAEEDLGHNLAWPCASAATSDLGSAPSLELSPPCTVQGLLGGGSLHRQEVGTATV